MATEGLSTAIEFKGNYIIYYALVAGQVLIALIVSFLTIEIEKSFSWEMAAIRIFSPLGEVTSIQSVVPKMIFRDDEVFLGDLEGGTTTFVQIETLGNPPLVNMQISGLVDGEPIAAVPTNPIEMGEE